MAQQDQMNILKDTLRQACAQLKERLEEDRVPDEFIEGFSIQEFRVKLVRVVHTLSFSAQRACFAFSEPSLPVPPECEALVSGVKEACTDVLAVFCELPRSQGRTLRTEVADNLREVYDAVNDLVSSISSLSHSFFHAAARLRKKCDVIAKIPKDNKEAVSSILLTRYELISDAIREFREVIDREDALAMDLQHMPVRNGFIQPRALNLSPQERALVNPGIVLAKTLRSTMRKVRAAVNSHGQCTNVQEIEELDKIADLSRVSSQLVDNFIIALNPPIVATIVRERGAALKEHVLAMLDATKNCHLYNSAEENWVDFLERAASHHYQTLLLRVDEL